MDSRAPATRFARNDDVSLAYQRYGEGTVELVIIPPLATNIELTWDRPELAYMLERFGTFAKVTHFDKRGTGASDRSVDVPTVDQRVEDTRAVMDHVGVERAVLMGVSEGGPMAVLFALTYPERVSALILHSSAAYFGPPDLTPEAAEARNAWLERFLTGWGTEDSITLERFAPTVARDPEFSAWQQRHERHSASPKAIRELFEMIGHVDVRDVLPRVDVPTLVLHRTGDLVVPVERARDLAAGIPGARMVEFDGSDHFQFIGETKGWLDVMEEFVTGLPPRRRSATTAAAAADLPVPVQIRTLGGLSVHHGEVEVPVSDWGSRRARQLCKRLAAAGGAPIAREVLVDWLWPDEDLDQGRLFARLSVQLSTVRRILGGGIIADRTSVRLDLHAVRLDLAEFDAAVAADNPAAAAAVYRGPFLPEDLYEDWAGIVRDRAAAAFAAASRDLVRSAVGVGQPQRALRHALEWLDSDQYDEAAHHAVIGAMKTLARHADARSAYQRYAARMAELGMAPVAFDTVPPLS